MAIPFLSDIRLPSAGKVYLWTGHNDNFLKYDLWQASASAGMTIKNIANSGSIFFQTNSTTALTLDSSQNVIAADAFTGKLQGAVTGAPDATIWRVSGQYTNWGIFYDEGTPDKIQFKASGTVTSTIALDNGDITTSGILDVNGTGTSTFAGPVSITPPSSTGWQGLTITGSGTSHTQGAIILKSSTTDTPEARGQGVFMFNEGDDVTWYMGTRYQDADEWQLGRKTGTSIDTSAAATDQALIKVNSTGNATFTGDIAVGPKSNATVQVSESGNSTVKMLAGSVGRVGTYSSHNLNLMANSNTVLTLDTSQNATFSGNVDISGTKITMDTIMLQDAAGGRLGFNRDTSNGDIHDSSYNAYQIQNNTGASQGGKLEIQEYNSNGVYVASTFITGNKLYLNDYVVHNGDENTYYGFEASDTWRVVVGGAEALNINTSRIRTNKHIEPAADSTYNIGTNSVRFSNVYADTLHGTVALSSEASNLGSFDDRDMAPEDMSFSDDLKLFFVEKSGIEGGTVGSNWQDALFISSYVDSSGGNPNLLAFDKSEKKIYHYQASATATSWGTPKELAYTDSVLDLNGGTLSGDIAMGNNDITGVDRIAFDDGIELYGSGNNNYLRFRSLSTANGGIHFYDGDNTTQGYLYYDGGATSAIGFLDGTGSWAVRCVENQYVELRYDNSVKFRTSNTGVNVTGNMAATNDVSGAGDLSIRNVKLNQGNSPTITLGVVNSSTGNSKIQFYSKNSGNANGYAVQYNKDTNIDRLEFIDGSGTANIKFINGGAAEFAGSVTATQINTGQGATEVHLMNQNLRTTDDVTFDNLIVTGNITVTGDLNTVSVTDLDVSDKTITVGVGQSEANSGGSGLKVSGPSTQPSILWDEGNDTWDFNYGIHVSGQSVFEALDASESIIQHLRCSNGNNAATFRTSANGHVFEIRSQNNGSIKIDSSNTSFTGYVNAANGFRMDSGQAIDFVDSNIGYNSIKRNTTLGGIQITTGGNSSMNLLDNGNVGVGGAHNPGSKFQVDDYTVGSNGSQTIYGNISSFSDSGSENLFLGIKNASYPNRGWAFNPVNSGVNCDLVIKEHGSTAERMRIKSGGVVTINDTGEEGWSGNKLNIGDTGDTASGINILTSTTGNAYILFSDVVDDSATEYANQIRFSHTDNFLSTNIGGTERMRINSSGDVGIGTSNPTAKLHVNGNLELQASWQIGSNDGSYWQRIRTVDSSSATAQAFNFETRNGSGSFITHATILNNGNVGVGIAPVAKLHVYQNDSADDTTAGVTIEQDGTGDAALSFLLSGTRRWRLGIDNNDSDKFKISDSTNLATSNKLTIDTSGDVGIGTTSPTRKLTVIDAGSANGSQNITAQFSNQTSGATSSAIYIGASSGADWLIGKNIYGVTSQTYFQIGNQAGTTPALTIAHTTNNVGIGTTSPSAKLHIEGGELLMKNPSGSAAPSIRFEGNSGGTQNATLTFDQSSQNTFTIATGYVSPTDLNRINIAPAGDVGLTVIGGSSNTPQVGIGTTSPTYKLSVAGAISGSGFVTYTKNYGSLNSSGNAVAGITADANGNGSSCGFTFTCFGGAGKYQKVVYACYNDSGTWRTKKVIDEGTNDLDVAASADGSTITFTFRATSSTQYYTPRVKVEAEGHNINSTYA